MSPDPAFVRISVSNTKVPGLVRYRYSIGKMDCLEILKDNVVLFDCVNCKQSYNIISIKNPNIHKDPERTSYAYWKCSRRIALIQHSWLSNLHCQARHSIAHILTPEHEEGKSELILTENTSYHRPVGEPCDVRWDKMNCDILIMYIYPQVMRGEMYLTNLLVATLLYERDPPFILDSQYENPQMAIHSKRHRFGILYLGIIFHSV